MKRLYTLIVLLAAALSTSTTQAQSTISDDTWNLSFGKGFWAALLPEYDAGRNLADTQSVLQDDGDTPGAIWELGAIRRFEGTRTSLEARGFFALALANRNDDNVAGIRSIDPTDGDPWSGVVGYRTHLDADTYHWGFDLAFRDTWRTRFGGLSAGLGFSQMAFNQNFVSETTQIGGFPTETWLDESIDSYYLGGIGFVGWDGYLFNRASTLDLTYGYYDLDTRYEADSEVFGIEGFKRDRGDQAFKLAIDGTTYAKMGHHTIGLTLGATYISDIAVIRRVPGTGSVLDTDEAVTLTAMVEWLY